MDKIQKKIHSCDNLNFINLNYVCWNLRTALATFMILLISLLIKPVLAGDIAEKRIILENQPTQLNAKPSPQKSKASPLNAQSNISLRERLLAFKTNQILAESIRKSFTVQVQPETFGNSFSGDNLLLESESGLETKDTLVQDLLAEQKINHDLQLEDQTNVLQPKQPQTIGEIDSSAPVDDNFGNPDKIRQELFIDPIINRQQALIKPQAPKAWPGSTAGTPSGYGASAGQVYIGVGVVFPLDEDSDASVDGSYSAGFGLGDPFKFVGLEINANFTSAGGDFLKGGEFDVGTSGYMGLKLHKYFADGTAVAVGWSNAVKWGESSSNKDTVYGVVTKAFPLQPNNSNNQLPLTISVGVGNGGFRSLGARETDENDVNVFGSVGLRVIPQLSLVSSWTGNRLNIGTSIAPFKNVPLIINGIFTDVTRNFDTGLGLSLSAGYSFQF
ncbi:MULTISPECIES: hypothetical protein [unclassified Nodularia (in: cyanobacteria)]|uniref:hypothetical protein n=1 Tax=unclassified Nodularia (in: cyanobacteria) TaxID=2656917 RepID=UPI00187E1813|nr:MULTISPECIES: hypothetical protein [unclassified Nodularia (in: cyanobacteria)]MBE9200815.1 hypothetical protein [Nodularia sp. LEGE 06071]MCC2693803.1 hypothetical protein [Nodularia sp. LEGE 04288]